MDERILGTVIWFSNERGFGFIKRDDDPEEVQHFVHFSYIEKEGYKTLKKDQRVSFVPTKTDAGIQAHKVIPE